MRRLLFAALVATVGACGDASSSDPANAGAGAVDAAVHVADAHAGDAPLVNDAAADARAETSTADAAVSYDDVVLADDPIAFWRLDRTTGTEPDVTGHGNDGTYEGGKTASGTMPNGDPVAVFDGASQYVTVPSNAALSIPTTHALTWEGWIRPDVLQFPNGPDGYVDWMGKCAAYSPTCEWEARMYNTTNAEGRCNRLSAYVFNPSAGLGSAADWQPTCGLLQTGAWYHVVGEYTTSTQPADCPSASTYPGSIDIWVDGVEWNQAAHSPTGCMSQYNVVPAANDSPLNIGTMAADTWFKGAIGKVAIYDHLLTPARITTHYRTMAGRVPSGSCAATCTLGP